MPRWLVRAAFALALPASAHAQQVLPSPVPAASIRPAAVVVVTSTVVFAAALTHAIVLDRLAVGDLNEYRRAPSTDVRERGERRALFSDVGFGVAGVSAGVAVAAVAILLLCPRRPSLAPRRAVAQLGVSF